jgi:hypothetical protein
LPIFKKSSAYFLRLQIENEYFSHCTVSSIGYTTSSNLLCTILLGFPRKTFFTFDEIEILTKLYPNIVEILKFRFSEISIPISMSKSEFRFRFLCRNLNFDFNIKVEISKHFSWNKSKFQFGFWSEFRSKFRRN